MQAVRYFGKNDVRIVEIDKPVRREGEVLIKIGSAGVCHSDLHLIQQGTLPGPFTLGHENAGWIEEIDDDVGLKKGESVIVYGPWGCGHCHACQESFENYCQYQSESAVLGGGLGTNGGMAEYMIVPNSRLLIPLGELSPREAASLSDAALTPYHAIKRSLTRLAPDTMVVVLGIGGLGHVAIQLLKHLCAATIIAGDTNDDKLALARQLGADHVINTRDTNDAIKQIRAFTGVQGAELVLDCVGVQPTYDIGAKVLGLDSQWTILGLGGGSHKFTKESIPFGASLCTPYWGGRSELMEVIALAQNGMIKIETSEYPLSDALKVYDLLNKGQISGRAVLIP